MTTHVEHLRAALDEFDEARQGEYAGPRHFRAADELATRVRDLLEQIEGVKREKPDPPVVSFHHQPGDTRPDTNQTWDGEKWVP